MDIDFECKRRENCKINIKYRTVRFFAFSAMIIKCLDAIVGEKNDSD
ncbi:MAG: hypothetical protein ABSH06_17335 [Thermodesulfobacteriota bacterium]|jgi:hypothetical protein